MTNYMPKFGLWIADSPNMVSTAAFWDRFVDVGYNVADIMLDSSRPDWDARYTLSHLRVIRQLAMIARDVELGGSVWPAPHPDILKAMYDDLDIMLPTLGAYFLCSDMEGLMLPSVAREMGWNLVDAKKQWIEYLWRLKEKHNIRIELTTHTGHPEANADSYFAASDVVDRHMWQVYSQRVLPNGDTASWDGRYGPQRRVEDSARLARKTTQLQKRLGFGQAVYNQRWPDRTISQAMRIPHEGYIRHCPEEIRDWSSWNTIGMLRGAPDNKIVTKVRNELITETRNRFRDQS